MNTRVDRTEIDRTTDHMCPGLAADVAYFEAQGRDFCSCVNCEAPIPVQFVYFAHLCGPCRFECTDASDATGGACAWCGTTL